MWLVVGVRVSWTAHVLCALVRYGWRFSLMYFTNMMGKSSTNWSSVSHVRSCPSSYPRHCTNTSTSPSVLINHSTKRSITNRCTSCRAERLTSLGIVRSALEMRHVHRFFAAGCQPEVSPWIPTGCRLDCGPPRRAPSSLSSIWTPCEGSHRCLGTGSWQNRQCSITDPGRCGQRQRGGRHARDRLVSALLATCSCRRSSEDTRSAQYSFSFSAGTYRGWRHTSISCRSTSTASQPSPVAAPLTPRWHCGCREPPGVGGWWCRPPTSAPVPTHRRRSVAPTGTPVPSTTGPWPPLPPIRSPMGNTARYVTGDRR